MDSLLLLAQAAEDLAPGGILAGGACMFVGVILGLVGFVLWIWALVHAIRNPALDSNERLIWVLVIIFLQLIGALIYVIVARKGEARKGV
ncbi:MAG: PLD nuclease N-terminal domain-containing protein [Planctomycetes bacterium]|nr:PLD nuclease N-terminal domain-containing protein [Planctomycetota bacterium]